METERYGAGVFTLRDFLSAEECAAHIARSERGGFEEAGIRGDDGEYIYKDARNNDRLIVDDADLAAALFERARSCLPPELEQWRHAAFRARWRLSRLNERWRYYRYDRQHQFRWHYDGVYRPNEVEESRLTFMIYLNDDFEGGATEFSWDRVQPRRGMALVFPHMLNHQGSTVTAGVKYVLRTDVIYARV